MLRVGPQALRSGSAQCPAFAPGIAGDEGPERKGSGRSGGRAWLGPGRAEGLGLIRSAHRQAGALGASSRLGEAFIPGSERPAADCGAGE